MDVPIVTALSYLPSISMIFSLVYIKQSGQTEVGDLHVVWVLNQNIAGGQVPVHQPDFLQITHALHTHHHQPQAMCPQMYELISHQI